MLVIVAGGNIGLHARQEINSKSWVVRPMPAHELEQLVIDATVAPENAGLGTIMLRENSEQGVSVRVKFEEIESKTEKKGAEDLDSAQLDPEHWKKIASHIEDRYYEFEGFVILHGLDTMAYTASALSFMLGQPTVPVVLTGAQRPVNFGRTDALQNIISSIAIAASAHLGIHPIVQEVCVYSHDTLFRGNRVTMTSSSSYKSFDSPNYPPLAVAGENIEIQDSVVRRAGTSRGIGLNRDANAMVEIVDIFPGMRPKRMASLTKLTKEQLTDLAEQGEEDGERVRGVLLRTYGMGTAPTNDGDFLKALKDLVDAKIVVMSVTQARSGRISRGTDPVSVRLLEQGVVSGGDMTAEAAYAKMVVLLSQSADAGEVADRLQIAHCGEQSQSVFNVHFDAKETEEPQADSENGKQNASCTAYLRQENVVEGHQLEEEDITHIQLRLLGIRPAKASEGVQLNDLSVYFENAQGNSADNEGDPDIHERLRWDDSTGETLNLVRDVTESVKEFAKQPGQLIVRLETTQPIRWARASLAIFSSVRLTS